MGVAGAAVVEDVFAIPFAVVQIRFRGNAPEAGGIRSHR
jgi:hypothetical protein